MAATRTKAGAKKGGQANRAKKRAEANEAPGKFPGAWPETTNGPVPSEAATSEPETPVPEHRVRDKVAKGVGMSGRSYEKAKVVVDAADEDPEQFGPIKEEMDRTGKVDPAYRKVRQRQTKDETARSWSRQPGETGSEWTKRLRDVDDKDKKGQIRLFERIFNQAMRDEGREKRLAEKQARFALQKEEESFFQSLCRRRDKWPQEMRPEFISVPNRCVSRIANGDEPASPTTMAKEESPQHSE